MNSMHTPPKYEATVVFTTINRKEDLRRAIQSAVEQMPPVEIIVIGDGSPKEIINMISDEFPTVRLFHTIETKGISVQRNWGVQLATTPIVFSIDDDAAFTSRDIISQTLNEFDHPLVGAVAMPFIDVFRDREHGTHVPDEDLYVDYLFIGTAYALRRDLFLKLGGYEEVLQFQGEEEDYCARLLDAGYIISCGHTEPIHHFVSPIRSWKKIAFLGARNAVLYTYINVPVPYLFSHLIGTSIMNVLSGIKKKMFFSTINGLLKGYQDCFSSRVKRRPVSRNTYKLIRRLRRNGPAKLSFVQKFLNKPLLG